MPELLPCPFCDGEAEYTEWPSNECEITVNHKEWCWLREWEGYTDILLEEKDKMIEAWNTRHESTCRIIGERDSLGYMSLVCSVCKSPMDDDDNFCSKCGRKVVD